MKTFAQKIATIIFVIALTSGCASVTDSGSLAKPEKTKISQPTQPGQVGEMGDGADVRPIYDKPD